MNQGVTRICVLKYRSYNVSNYGSETSKRDNSSSPSSHCSGVDAEQKATDFHWWYFDNGGKCPSRFGTVSPFSIAVFFRATWRRRKTSTTLPSGFELGDVTNISVGKAFDRLTATGGVCQRKLGSVSCRNSLEEKAAPLKCGEKANARYKSRSLSPHIHRPTPQTYT